MERKLILLTAVQPLIAAGLKHILASNPKPVFFDAVKDEAGLLNYVTPFPPDMLLIEYHSQSVLYPFATAAVNELMRKIPTLMVIGEESPEQFNHYIEKGAKGIITRACGEAEAVQAVNALLEGKTYFCQQVVEKIMQQRSGKNSRPSASSGLTSREKEVLRLIAEGYTTMQIADQLHLSYHTINTHRKHLSRKLGIKSAAAFAIHAIRLGLIPPGQL